jgi:excisionase family DNA binding protein
MSGNEAVAEQIRRLEPIVPQADERPEVEKLLALLDGKGASRHLARPCRLIGPLGEEIELPASIFYILERVVEVMAHGDAITVVPVGQELTTQQAANILNVSRQYLVRLLENGEIPFEKTGAHRRLRIKDVLAYRHRRAKERGKALDDLTALSEDSGGYPELN